MMAYIMVKYSIRTIVRNFSYTNFVISICYLVFQIPRLVIRVLKLVSEKDSTISWRNFLWLKAHSLDDKAIFFMKEERTFIVNGSKSQTIKILTELCQIKTFNVPQIETFAKKVNDLQLRPLKLNEKFLMTKTTLYLNKTMHIANLEIANSKTEVAFYTDYKKAHLNELYSKRATMNKFSGPKKETTALETSLDEVKLGERTFKTAIIRELEGVSERGYSSQLVSGKFQDSLGAFEEFDIKCHKLMEGFDLNSNEIQIVRKALLNANEPINWCPSNWNL